MRQCLYTPEMLALVEESKGTCEATDYLLGMFRRASGLGPLDQMLLVDTLSLLPGDFLVKMDRMSMAHSLEARSPFLDHKLIELAARLPEACKRKGGNGKILLKQAFADLLPKDILSRKKQGFGVPVGHWFRSELHGMVREALLCSRASQRGLFRVEMISTFPIESLLPEQRIPG